MSALSRMRYGILGVPLAFVGLPLYVHVPRFYAEVKHVGLAQLGLVLLILRLFDTVLDPLIGSLSDRLSHHRRAIMAACLLPLAAGYYLLFSPPAGTAESMKWLIACLAVVYVAFSSLMINYYALGLELAKGYDDNTRLAAWREGSMLLGVLLASLLPSVFAQNHDMAQSYHLFGLLLCPLLLACAFFTLTIPVSGRALQAQSALRTFAVLFKDRMVLWMLIVALFNAVPTAITSTLFLFFTTDLLKLPDQSGPMLAAYFLSAALAVPLWTRISARWSKRTALLVAMVIAIMSFIWAWGLGPGDAKAFYCICVLSGMTLGADSILLTSLFADVLKDKTHAGSTAFGLWNFTSKLTMALAAGIALPALARYGYVPAQKNTPEALHALAFCYALLPCILKALAFLLLCKSPLDRMPGKERNYEP